VLGITSEGIKTYQDSQLSTNNKAKRYELSKKERFLGAHMLPETFIVDMIADMLPSRISADGKRLSFSQKCQILRSAGEWSMGLRAENIEHSIHNAYVSLIERAEHFIYIENQFFVSSVCGSPVENTIAQAIVDRVTRAIIHKEQFKVIVVLPLLPGFEGGIDSSNANVLRIQLGWQHETIHRGKNSIMKQ